MKTPPPNALQRIAPITRWLPRYQGAWLRTDALAGLAVAAVAIPTAMGYSTVALVPVQVGLYALPAALLLYAVFGSSRQLSIGPTSTVSLMSGSVVAAMDGASDPGEAAILTAAVAIAGGLWLAAFGILRLGWVTDFISRPVIVGFSFGLGVTVMVGELPHLLGVPVSATHVTQKLTATVQEVGQTNLISVALGLAGLAMLLIGGKRMPAVPWALILMTVGVVIAHTWDPADHGMEVLGTVPPGLPHLGLPSISAAELGAIALGGLAIAVAGVGEGLSAARIFAARGDYRINADSEFLATGMANVGAGLCGGMGVCGSLSRSGTAVDSGARTQVSGVFAALATGVFLATMTGLLDGVPRVVLTSIVMASVWFLLDVSTLRYYRRVRRNDFTSALAGLAGVLVFGPLYGLLAAVSLSLLGLVYRSSKVRVETLGRIRSEKAAWGSITGHDDREQTPGVLVLRLDAPLFWANCESTHEEILLIVDDADDVKALVLDLEATGQMDATTEEMLSKLLHELRRDGIELFIARLHHNARGVLSRSGFAELLGPGHTWHSISQAVKAAKAHIAGKKLPDQDDAFASWAESES